MWAAIFISHHTKKIGKTWIKVKTTMQGTAIKIADPIQVGPPRSAIKLGHEPVGLMEVFIRFPHQNG
jgi:hypothetical protein